MNGMQMMRRVRAVIFLLPALFWAAASAGAGAQERLVDDFEQGLSPGWEAKSFQGETVYQVVPDGGGHSLRAESRDAASGLVYKLDYDAREYPFLVWRWKVANILENGDARKKEGDDYAARVYVVFPHWFFLKTKSINYIWANRLPKGEHIPNPFAGNAIMVAVESGSENVGKWVAERRNIYEDYRMLFGEDPPRVGAIAIMTDTDNTGGVATAWYDDIRIGR